MIERCPWPGRDDLYIRYHDSEWGVPVHCDRKWYELLVLEGAQAGLSWITVLRKREKYREVFAQFEPSAVSAFGEEEIEKLMSEPGIVKNRLKIASAVNNAKRFLDIQREWGAFDNYVWTFTRGGPIVNGWRSMSEVPSVTDKALEISLALKGRGFTFIGPKIVYALMQSAGMVNDHLLSCFRHAQVAAMR